MPRPRAGNPSVVLHADHDVAPVAIRQADDRLDQIAIVERLPLFPLELDGEGLAGLDQLAKVLRRHAGAAPRANISSQSMFRLVTPNRTSSDPENGRRM